MKGETGTKVKVSTTKMGHDLHDVEQNVIWIQSNLAKENTASTEEIKDYITKLGLLKWKMKAHIIFRKLIS